MPDILPSYHFDTRTSRYHSSETGRFVGRRTIVSLLESRVDGAAARYVELTTAFYEGRLSPAAWVEQMQTEQRRLTLQNEALGRGGWDRLGAKQYGRAGRDLRDQYAKIAGTARDIVGGKITLAQALARVNEYAGAARVHFWQAERETVQRSSSNMIVIWRRFLGGGGKSCKSCISYYNQGWSLDVPMPGVACECGGNCKCNVEHREVPANEVNAWLGTKRAA